MYFVGSIPLYGSLIYHGLGTASDLSMSFYLIIPAIIGQFFGTKIRGRSSNFSGLLGRYEIKENFLYSKPLKFRIDLSGVKQG